jgi:RNA polymerase sigma-70 factor (ECF subfamily)
MGTSRIGAGAWRMGAPPRWACPVPALASSSIAPAAQLLQRIGRILRTTGGNKRPGEDVLGPGSIPRDRLLFGGRVYQCSMNRRGRATVGGDDIEARIAGLIPRLHRFAWVLTGNRTDADDITQATLERALERKASFTAETPLEAWAVRVARNLWLDQLRRKKVRLVAVDPAMLGGGGAEGPELRLEAQAALAAMQTLPDGQREVAALVLVEGYSYQEAATALQAPIGTVMSRLARARRALAELLLGPEDAGAGEVQGAEL